MTKVAGRSLLGLVAALALLASGCGTAVSTRQASAEAREDARRAGLAGRSVGGLSAGGGDSGLVDPVTGEGTGGAGSGGSSALGGGAATGGASAGASVGGASGQSASGGKAALPCAGGGASDTGITATDINIGWVGTLTGPVPGLFRGALIGTQAYASYLNSKGGLCGRRVRVKAADDALDSGKNRAAHLQLKDQVFAFVGSFSVSDDGGAQVLADCKCPDIGTALARVRNNLHENVPPQPVADGWRTGTFKYMMSKYPADVFTHVAFFVSAVQSAREIAANERKVMEGLGMKVVYTREVQPNEQNFTGDVVQMQNTGTKMLVYQGDVGNMGRMAKTIHDQNFRLTIAAWGGAIYDSNAFAIAGKEALEGALIDNTYGMFQGEDAGRMPEIALFDQWMKRIDPNQSVDLFSFFSWLSAKLFAENMVKLDTKPTRAGILAQLYKVGVWDADGAIAPVNIGLKKPSDCFMVFKITNGTFVREYPKDKSFDCNTGGFVYTK